MINHSARLIPNGDGTGRLEITVNGVSVKERKPGFYMVVDIEKVMPLALRCEGELLRPTLIVKLFCKSKNKRAIRLKKAMLRFQHGKRQLIDAR